MAQIGGATYAVAVQGNYAYIGVGPRLVVLGVSNPAGPTVIGRTEVLPGVVEDAPGYAEGVAVSGTYAYVADRDGGLIILRFTISQRVYLPLVLRNR